MLLDDIVDSTDRDSNAERLKTIQFVKDCPPFLNVGGDIIGVWTRWAVNDITHEIQENINKEYAKIKQKGYNIIKYTPYITGSKELQFPNILSQDILDSKKIEIGAVNYQALYLQNPIPLETRIFDITKIKYYKELPSNLRHILAIDIALGGVNSDYTALIHAGFDNVGNIYIIDAVIERLTLSQLDIVLAGKLNIQNYNSVILEYNIEKHFIDELKNRLIKDHAGITNSTIKNNIVRIKKIIHNTKKEYRIELLEPVINCGMLYLPDNNNSNGIIELKNEILGYSRVGSKSKDDGLDALSMAHTEIRKNYIDYSGMKSGLVSYNIQDM